MPKAKTTDETAPDAEVSTPGSDLITGGPKGPEVEVTRVLIMRDEHTHIPMDVPAYEVPILEIVHGADKIKPLDHEGTRPLDTDDAEQEYQRLVRKYDTRNGINPVVQVYGSDPAKLADAMGLEFSRSRGGRAKAQLKGSLNTDGAKK